MRGLVLMKLMRGGKTTFIEKIDTKGRRFETGFVLSFNFLYFHYVSVKTIFMLKFKRVQFCQIKLSFTSL